MSEEETKVEATTELVDVEAEASTEYTMEGATPLKKKKKWPIIVGVVAVVLVAAGAGFWVWHEQPSFCNAICHVPMDPYNATYDAVAGEAGTDKWGNEVTNANAMLAVSHKTVDGTTCMECHVPSLGEQIAEGMSWVSGNYFYPLAEASLGDLVEARGVDEDQFCLNEACHSGVTRESLVDLTADMDRNPHQSQHGSIDCDDCHKAHRASVNYCSQCHTDSDIPDGWLSVEEAKNLTQP